MPKKKEAPVIEEGEINDMPLCECADNRSHHAVFSSKQYDYLSNKFDHLDNNDLSIMRLDCHWYFDRDFEVLEETEVCKIVRYKSGKDVPEEPKKFKTIRRRKSK